MHLWIVRGIAVASFCLAPLAASAVILSNPSVGRNLVSSSPPTGTFSNSGSQYTIKTGSFAFTAIGPRTLLIAAHTVGADPLPVPGAFSFNSVTYTPSAISRVGGTDMAIVTVNNTFPNWAPLYNASTDGSLVGKTVVIYGDGKSRGSEYHLSSTPASGESTLRGWNWGTVDWATSWGTNTIDSLGYGQSGASSQELILWDFDETGTAYEGTLAYGDSGGGVFAKSTSGIWKLVGVNYGVEATYRLTSGGANSEAAVFDKGNLIYVDSAGEHPFTDTVTDIPSLAGATNVSNYLTTLNQYAPKPGDANADQVVNTRDFNILAANFGMVSGGTWLKGDFNYDGAVNSADFALFTGNYGKTLTFLNAVSPGDVLGGETIGVVPEPSAIGLLAISSLALGTRRKR